MQRAYLREPEVARPRDAQEVPERRLHRADRVHHVEIGVGDDVGRDRQGQEQRPVEDALSRKAEHRDEPSGANADDNGHQSDAGEQQHGGVDRVRQDVGDEVRPDVARAARREEGKAAKRRHHEDKGEERGGEPAGVAAGRTRRMA